MTMRHQTYIISLAILSSAAATAHAFLTVPPRQQPLPTPCLRMSFMADSSDYKADKTDFGDGDDDGGDSSSTAPLRGEVDMADVPVTDEIAVPASRNNIGNRFLALVFDRSHSSRYDADAKNEEEYANSLWDMHEDRIALTEDHVMWARKQNLYNDTFNTQSLADVLWSHQL